MVVIGDVFQPIHLMLIMGVALLVLGPKRLPEVGRTLGKGLREFRSAMSGITEESHELMNHARVEMPKIEPQPEPVMATATSSEQPSSAGTGTEESPALAPRNDEQD